MSSLGVNSIIVNNGIQIKSQTQTPGVNGPLEVLLSVLHSGGSSDTYLYRWFCITNPRWNGDGTGITYKDVTGNQSTELYWFKVLIF